MLNIELRGVVKSFEQDQEKTDVNSWVVWRRLVLHDLDQDVDIPEWFYIVACSQEYLVENPNKFSETERRQVVVQKTFNEAALEESAVQRFNALSFSNWDEFYRKMPEVFIHEDGH